MHSRTNPPTAHCCTTPITCHGLSFTLLFQLLGDTDSIIVCVGIGINIWSLSFRWYFANMVYISYITKLVSKKACALYWPFKMSPDMWIAAVRFKCTFLKWDWKEKWIYHSCISWCTCVLCWIEIRIMAQQYVVFHRVVFSLDLLGAGAVMKMGANSLDSTQCDDRFICEYKVLGNRAASLLHVSEVILFLQERKMIQIEIYENQGIKAPMDRTSHKCWIFFRLFAKSLV